MKSVPIAVWWVGMAVLAVIGSPLAAAWFLSGLLMLVNCVVTVREKR